MFCELTPEIVNVGVNGAPVAIADTPDSCHPFVSARVNGLPFVMFGTLIT